MTNKIINIREKLFLQKGMIKQFFGELQNQVLMDEERDNTIHLLKNVYGYRNIDKIIDRKVKLEVLYPILDKFFSYYRIAEQEESNKK